MKIGYSIAKSGLGKVLVAATERGVSAVYLGDSDAELDRRIARGVSARGNCASDRYSFESWVSEIVRARGRKASTHGVAVWTCRRPRFSGVCGRSSSRFLAARRAPILRWRKAVGNPKAVRAVARACATNPVCIVVPCHRVIRRGRKPCGISLGAYRASSSCSHKNKPPSDSVCRQQSVHASNPRHAVIPNPPRPSAGVRDPLSHLLRTAARNVETSRTVYIPGLTRVTSLGQSGLNRKSGIFRFFITFE